MMPVLVLVAILHVLFAFNGYASPQTVLVLPFENLSKFKNIDWIGEGLAELVVDRLHKEKSLYVYCREERLLAYEKLGIPENAIVSRATAIKIGWELDADAIIIGSYDNSPEAFQISARVIDPTLSKISQETTSTGKLEDIIQLANEHSWKVLREIVPNPSITFADYTAELPAIPESAFENYVRGLLSLDRRARLNFFLQAARMHSDYWPAVVQLGRAFHLDGDYKTSNLWLEKIGMGQRDWAHASFLVGLNYLHLGEYAKAAAALNRIPPTYEVLVNLGAALSGKGDHAEAISAWKQAVEADPLSTEAYFNIAYGSLLRGDADGAVKPLRQVVKLQPRDGEALFLLGRAYEKLGQLEESQKAIGQASRLSPRTQQWTGPSLPRLERLMSQADLTALRQRQESLLRSQNASTNRAKGRDLVARLESAQMLIESQQYGEALKDLKQIIRLFPNPADAYLLLAQVYEHQKEFDLAIREYQRSIGIRSTADSYVSLSRAYRAANQIYSALMAAEKALKIEAGHPEALVLKADLEKLLPSARRSRP